MSETEAALSEIPAYIMALFALGFVVMLFIGGMINLDINVEQSQQVDYRRAAVLENLLSLDPNNSQLDDTFETEDYEYERRRAVIPVEYFAVKDSDNPNPGAGIGYRVEQASYSTAPKHCYIPDVGGLDGENFAYRIELLEDESENANGDYKEIPDECQDMEFDAGRASAALRTVYLRRSVFSLALLERSDNQNPPLPVRLYVYELR